MMKTRLCLPSLLTCPERRAERSDPARDTAALLPRALGRAQPARPDQRPPRSARRARRAAGERTSRKEIVATCILGAPDSADELVRGLRIYRRSPADSTATSGARLEDVLELRPVRPGRRPRRWRHRPPPT